MFSDNVLRKLSKHYSYAAVVARIPNEFIRIHYYYLTLY